MSAETAFADGLPSAILSEPEPRHLTEPRGRYRSAARLLARPRTTEEVAQVVRAAGQNGIGIVPYAGGTGLVGGQVSGAEAILLSVERLDRVREIDATDNVMVAEAGVILADARAAAAEVDRLFPLSIAAEGSARIGGNLSTNAGGVQVLRYGNARDLCLGLEAVLPDGQILHGLSRLRKDNTGYDLRHLLIGSEGTLGIITAASLKLFPRPRERVVALLAVASPAAALALLNRVRDQVGEALSAFEILAETSFAFLAETMPTLPRPFDTQPAWAVLLEVGSGEGSALEARLLPALEAAMEAGEVVDALIAQNEAQATDFWTLRESVPEANRKIGAIASHDISVPISRLPDFIAKARSALLREVPELRINCFGHVGDGNLHYNLFPPQGGSGSDFDTDRSRLTAIVHDLAHALGGSVSAEHGIGRLKRGDLAQYGDPAKLSTMRAIKAALDPLGIMNPGALFSDP